LKTWPEGAAYLPAETLPQGFQPEGSATWKDCGDRLALQQFSRKVRLDWAALARMTRSNKKPKFQYTRSGFNEYGDMVGHHGFESPPIAAPPVDGPIQEAALRSTVNRLNQFAAACESRQAQVFFAYPPTLAGCQPHADALHQMLTANLQIRVLHHPDECTFAPSDCFDTALHLRKEAAEIRSRFLADRLREQLSRADDRVIRR
jgi:hypothetical protein